MKKVIVSGCRFFTDAEFIFNKLDEYYPEPFILISGDADGVDTIGRWYAEARQYDIIRVPANWKRRGKSGGPFRNRLMGEIGDELIAFPSKKSTGTRNMISVMDELKKKYAVIEI